MDWLLGGSFAGGGEACARHGGRDPPVDSGGGTKSDSCVLGKGTIAVIGVPEPGGHRQNGDFLADKAELFKRGGTRYQLNSSVVRSIAWALVSTAVRFGDPAAEIISYAEKEKVDLIMMATHGHTGLARIVSGSVASPTTRRDGPSSVDTRKSTSLLVPGPRSGQLRSHQCALPREGTEGLVSAPEAPCMSDPPCWDRDRPPAPS